MTVQKQAGFTMIELLVSIVVLGVTLAITTSFILGVREKAVLQRDTDIVINSLEFARQQSIAAYNGESYSLIIQPPNVVSVQPGNVAKKLHKSIQIETVPDVSKVDFQKLTGNIPQAQTIFLRIGTLESKITIQSNGLIDQDPIKQQ